MNNEQTQTLSLKAAYSFGVSHGLESDVNEIRNMVIEWNSSYTSSLRRGYIISLFENRGISKTSRQHTGCSETLQEERRDAGVILRIKTQYEEFLAGRAPELDEQGDAELGADPQESLEFALAAHSPDFLCEIRPNRSGSASVHFRRSYRYRISCRWRSHRLVRG